MRFKLAGSSHVLTKVMGAQRRTALIFDTQVVGCASGICVTGVLVSIIPFKARSDATLLITF